MLAVKVRCNPCGKEKLPNEILTGNERRGYLCYACYYQHHENLNALAQARPRSCNDCGVSFAQLAERNPDATMTVQLKDGVLQLLCKSCAAKYEPKTHLYKGTEYAHRKGIHAGVK